MATLSLKHIDKIYDNQVQAVFDFNLDIADKEFIVFVGPSVILLWFFNHMHYILI